MLNLILIQSQAAAASGAAATSGAPQDGGMQGWSTIIMIGLMVLIFYFFMIRPQSKRQKDLKQKREALKKGDKVTTAGGIHGRIREIRDNTMVVEIADNVKITVDSSMIYPEGETTQNQN